MLADEKETFSTVCQKLPIGDVADEAQGPWWCYHSHGHALRHDPSTWALRPKPHTQPDLPWGQVPCFFCLISKTLQVLSWGLIYIFCRSCAGCPSLLMPLGQHRQCCSPAQGLGSISPPGVNWGCHQLEHPQQMSYFTSTYLFLLGNETTSFPRVARTVHSI